MTFNLYIVGYSISVYLISGMIYSDTQGITMDSANARKERRHDAGGAIALGLIGSIIWPIILVIVYLMTGFAQHGIWKSRK